MASMIARDSAMANLITHKSHKERTNIQTSVTIRSFKKGGNLVNKQHMWGNKELGKRIRELRRESNLTLRELGDLCGISWNTIQQFETGKRSINAFSLESIINGLGYELTIQKR